MNPNEEIRLIKENNLDACPECGNRKGNVIHLAYENPNGETTVECVECGISWLPSVSED